MTKNNSVVSPLIAWEYGVDGALTVMKVRDGMTNAGLVVEETGLTRIFVEV